MVNPPKPAVATGLLEGTLEGQDEDGGGDGDSKDGGDVKLNGEFENGLSVSYSTL